ncbi:MAG: hypothetical protein ABL925_02690 [Methylococcales bacterium]
MDSIQSRIGDYGSFFTDAKNRLSSKDSPFLRNLGTRDQNDPTVALLDAWSVTADVLSFYRERLTQESYLRTATDEGSLRQLANMVGFKPRPGIAATAHLAYLLEPSAKPVEIEPGAQVQTQPGPQEKMQTFETDEMLVARAEWSQMKPRQNRPSSIDILDALTRTTIRINDTSLFVRPGERVLFVFDMKLGYQVVREVLSAKTNIEQSFVELTLKNKDNLVLVLDKNKGKPETNLIEQLLDEREELSKKLTDISISQNLRHSLLLLSNILSSYLLGTDAISTYNSLSDLINFVNSPKASTSARTFKIVTLNPKEKKIFIPEVNKLHDIFDNLAHSEFKQSISNNSEATSLGDLLPSLLHPSSTNLKSSAGDLQLLKKQSLNTEGDVRIGLVQAMSPMLQDTLGDALRVMPANPVESEPSIYLLRTVVSPFGAVAPKNLSNAGGHFFSNEWALDTSDAKEGAAFLETVVDTITSDSFAIINTPFWSTTINSVEYQVSPGRLLRFALVRSAETIQRGSYNISGKITRLELVEPENTEKGIPLPVVLPIIFK